MEEMQSLSTICGIQTLGCGLWTTAALGGEHGFFLVWQSHKRIVPKMKTAPAGTPIITGHGRLLGDMLTGAMGGFGSVDGREEEKVEKNGCN